MLEYVLKLLLSKQCTCPCESGIFIDWQKPLDLVSRQCAPKYLGIDCVCLGAGGGGGGAEPCNFPCAVFCSLSRPSAVVLVMFRLWP